MTPATAPMSFIILFPSRCLLTVARILRCKEPGMAASLGEKPGANLRDYLAEERTFLAWIRTGLALIRTGLALTGFGFVVARFGLFLEEIQISRGGAAAHPHSLSLWFGT